MKDIPIFPTQYGVASLILKEIPYQQTAYIIIRDSLEPEKLITECRDFCCACGAEKIYATGHPTLETRTFLTAMWEMRCPVESIPDMGAALWPVQEQTLESWRQIYNQKVKAVPNGAWMTEADGREMLKKGDGYFIHRNGELLGIGRGSGETIDWIASVKPGAGREVVCALAHALSADTAVLTVASENKKAVTLYEGIGFIKSKEIARWFEV